jgi:hypothetical protein
VASGADYGYGVPLMIFDVESIGLHGEGFAVGWIVVWEGKIQERTLLTCHPDQAVGQPQGREWVMEHVWPQLCQYPLSLSTHAIQEAFWQRWSILRGGNGMLMADCPWPVETNFLNACVAWDPQDRYWAGPFPLLDAATLRAYGQAKPTRDLHDPLQDAIETWTSLHTQSGETPMTTQVAT